VYWSAAVAELVPPPVVTVISTVPAPSAGATALIFVDETNVTDPELTVPKVTAASGVKPVPLTVTVLPPCVWPDVGSMLVTAGGP
jgi:hypothetical protein